MKTEYKCPYCGRNSYATTSKTKGNFTDWKSVAKHISKCDKNNHTHIICEFAGPISIQEILDSNITSLKKKYPKTRFRDKLKYCGVKVQLTHIFSKEEVLLAIKDFYTKFGRIPEYRDFDNPDNNYPTTPVVKRLFVTWNNAIASAGFEPNIQNGFGINTVGLDGHLYRSSAEAYFADTFLYKKYIYDIEPKYPIPYNRYYDWYIEELDLYIELDGGIRPDTIKEKILINKALHRSLLCIATTSIYSKTFSLEKRIEEIRASKVAGTAC